jgi:hypothetical protein
MGDMGDYWRETKDATKALRAMFGVECTMCKTKQPKRTPTILLPQQRCKVDGYRDARPRLTDSDEKKALEAAGYFDEP